MGQPPENVYHQQIMPELQNFEVRIMQMLEYLLAEQRLEFEERFAFQERRWAEWSAQQQAVFQALLIQTRENASAQKSIALPHPDPPITKAPLICTEPPWFHTMPQARRHSMPNIQGKNDIPPKNQSQSNLPTENTKSSASVPHEPDIRNSKLAEVIASTSFRFEGPGDEVIATATTLGSCQAPLMEETITPQMTVKPPNTGKTSQRSEDYCQGEDVTNEEDSHRASFMSEAVMTKRLTPRRRHSYSSEWASGRAATFDCSSDQCEPLSSKSSSSFRKKFEKKYEASAAEDDNVSDFNGIGTDKEPSQVKETTKVSEKFKSSIRSTLKAECQELMKPPHQEHCKSPIDDSGRRGSAPAVSMGGQASFRIV